MSSITDYKARVTGNIKQSLSNNTKHVINSVFANSPFYRQVIIEGATTDVRVVQEQEYNKKTLLFKPVTKIDIGSYIDIDTEKWIALDFFNNEIYPKSTIYQCNEVLKWKDKVGVVHQYGCYINKGRGTVSTSPGGTFDLELPSGYMYLDVQMNTDTMQILLSQRFIINGRIYRIDGIDNVTQFLNGKGVIKFTIKPDTKIETADDFVNRIADNSVLYGGSSAGSPPPTGGNPW